MVIIPEMDEIIITDSALNLHVKNALKAAIQGNSESYDELVGLFHRKELSASDVAYLVVFDILIESFKKSTLPAVKPRFAQFLVFYPCSLDPVDCGMKFADQLENSFLNSPVSELRVQAVAYLGSYLARAKFVSASFIGTYLESVVEWCCKYQDGDSINPIAHQVFYVACQGRESLWPHSEGSGGFPWSLQLKASHLISFQYFGSILL